MTRPVRYDRLTMGFSGWVAQSLCAADMLASIGTMYSSGRTNPCVSATMYGKLWLVIATARSA